ncbi:MAG: DUF763 domain-containing protein [Candidatus Baldrarchaeia archaeon]
MKKVGIAELPLHHGTCPPWLFKRMVKLSRIICEIIISEFGVNEFLIRLSDPFFFQSFGCVLGYDYHSSGITTTVTAALKEALNKEEYGVAVCGGKGKTSLKTPREIVKIGEAFGFSDDKIRELQRASRLVAKVDNAALQDGFQLYHHSMVISENGEWTVIQQGMCPLSKEARRYHWLSLDLDNFVNEPHTAIVSDVVRSRVLDMTAKKSEECRKVSLDLVKDDPKKLQKMFLSVIRDPKQKTLFDMDKTRRLVDVPVLVMPRRIDWKAVKKAYELQPSNYEELLLIKGVGPGAIRALALISEIIWGASPSWKDPVKFSFAHGGKDGVPYPVNLKRMEMNAQILEEALRMAKIGEKERIKALKRLRTLLSRNVNP